MKEEVQGFSRIQTPSLTSTPSLPPSLPPPLPPDLLHPSVEIGEEMLQAAARELVEETTLDHSVLEFYPRCFMTTDAIYNDDMGAVKYHFVISQVRTSALPPALLSAPRLGCSIWFSHEPLPPSLSYLRWCAGPPPRLHPSPPTMPRTFVG